MSQYLPRCADSDTAVPITVGAGGIVGSTPITTTGIECVDADTKVAGVAGFDAASGGVVTVWTTGIHTGIASGAVTNGQPLCTAVGGKMRVWVAGTDAVAAYIGRAWSTAADQGALTYSLFNV